MNVTVNVSRLVLLVLTRTRFLNAGSTDPDPCSAKKVLSTQSLSLGPGSEMLSPPSLRVVVQHTESCYS